MEDIGGLVVRIEANIKNAVAGMDAVERKISALSSQAESKLGPIMDKVGTAFKVIGTAAAAGFGAAIVGGVKGAAQLESYRNTLNTVMKDSKKAGEIMGWAVDFANKTPFETDSIVQATVRLQSYGLEAQKVMPSIGNMASVMNKDVMQAVEAVADAQTGELERLKEFGVTKQMIIDQAAKTMKDKQIVNNKGQITDQEGFNKALFSLMDERFKGGMEKQASSFTGLWSTVKGTFATTLATMAGISETGEVKIGGFFDKLKTKMQVVIDKIAEWQKNGQLQEWADKAGSALTTFWNIGEDIFNKLIETGKFIKDNWGLIEPILAGILAGYVAFKTITGILKAIEIAQAALNLVMAANPISLVVLAIAALVAGGILLYKNWDTIKAKANEIWGAIKKWVGGTIDSIKEKFDTFIKGTADIGKNIVKGLWDGISSLTEWIKTKVKGFVTAIGRTIKDFFGISSPSKLMIEYGKYIAEGLAEGIKNNTEKVKNTANIMAQAIVDAVGRIKENLSVAVDIAQAKFDLLKAQMGSNVKESKLLDAQLTMLKTQLTLQKEKVDILKDAYEKMAKAKGNANIESQKLYLELIKEQTAQEDLINTIAEVNKAKQISSVPWGKAFQGGELSGMTPEQIIASIPKLAAGTSFVPFDTMAFLHKGEAVIPANNNPNNSGAKNPAGQPLNFEGMFAGANFYVRSDNDIKLVAKELFNLQTTRARAGGTVYG